MVLLCGKNRPFRTILKKSPPSPLILRQALELNATGIILVSNSVNGAVEPTLRDIYLTDYVIISDSSYHSITDHQTYTLELLPNPLGATRIFGRLGCMFWLITRFVISLIFLTSIFVITIIY